MYAHQVYDKMDSEFKKYESKYKDIAMPFLMAKETIKGSTCFSFGDQKNLFEIIKKSKEKTPWKGLFNATCLPYEKLWFDYNVDDSLISKIGICVGGGSNKCDFIACLFFYFHDGEWDYFQAIIYFDINDGSFMFIPLSEVFNHDSHRKFSSYVSETTQALVNVSLLLLTCKNIVTKKNTPANRINSKRIKNGKFPLFTYHTLILKPVGNKQESTPKHLWENRIHLCRGHFKTYTEENPLFGKITGRYWWQPSVRGRNREGIVIKDYGATKLSGHKADTKK